jgi:sugar phosphate isomerase/epimerase
MLDFDAGHFFGSTGIHPNTIIEKYHDRIFSVHLKDKTGQVRNKKLYRRPLQINELQGSFLIRPASGKPTDLFINNL